MSLNNFKIPDQFSKDFFTKALKTGLNLSDIEVKDFVISYGSSCGDNYVSYIYRALVTYIENRKELKDISLIIKYMPVDSSKEFLKSLNMHGCEVKMYFEIIPKLDQILNIKLAPKCFYTVTEPVETIVFEDLKVSNYYIADRVSGLDERHSKTLLKRIAHFHAGSMVLAKKDPDSMNFFNRSVFHDDKKSKVKDELYLGNLPYMEKLLNTWPGYESIAKKLGKIKENFYRIMLKIITPQKDSIMVLNHGDLWISNFMFKEDNEISLDIVLIDLQVCYYGSLGIDINYFLNTSVNIDVLKSKRYELIRFYYASLKEKLEKLNYTDIPTWEQVRKEIFKTEFYGFFAFEALQPTTLLDRENSKNISLESFDNDEQSQKIREIAFGATNMQEVLKYSIDRFDELGVLDLYTSY